MLSQHQSVPSRKAAAALAPPPEEAYLAAVHQAQPQQQHSPAGNNQHLQQSTTLALQVLQQLCPQLAAKWAHKQPARQTQHMMQQQSGRMQQVVPASAAAEAGWQQHMQQQKQQLNGLGRVTNIENGAAASALAGHGEPAAGGAMSIKGTTYGPTPVVQQQQRQQLAAGTSYKFADTALPQQQNGQAAAVAAAAPVETGYQYVGDAMQQVQQYQMGHQQPPLDTLNKYSEPYGTTAARQEPVGKRIPQQQHNSLQQWQQQQWPPILQRSQNLAQDPRGSCPATFQQQQQHQALVEQGQLIAAVAAAAATAAMMSPAVHALPALRLPQRRLISSRDRDHDSPDLRLRLDCESPLGSQQGLGLSRSRRDPVYIDLDDDEIKQQQQQQSRRMMSSVIVIDDESDDMEEQLELPVQKPGTHVDYNSSNSNRVAAAAAGQGYAAAANQTSTAAAAAFRVPRSCELAHSNELVHPTCIPKVTVQQQQQQHTRQSQELCLRSTRQGVIKQPPHAHALVGATDHQQQRAQERLPQETKKQDVIQTDQRQVPTTQQQQQRKQHADGEGAPPAAHRVAAAAASGHGGGSGGVAADTCAAAKAAGVHSALYSTILSLIKQQQQQQQRQDVHKSDSMDNPAAVCERGDKTAAAAGVPADADHSLAAPMQAQPHDIIQAVQPRGSSGSSSKAVQRTPEAVEVVATQQKGTEPHAAAGIRAGSHKAAAAAAPLNGSLEGVQGSCDPADTQPQQQQDSRGETADCSFTWLRDWKQKAKQAIQQDIQSQQQQQQHDLQSPVLGKQAVATAATEAQACAAAAAVLGDDSFAGSDPSCNTLAAAAAATPAAVAAAVAGRGKKRLLTSTGELQQLQDTPQCGSAQQELAAATATAAAAAACASDDTQHNTLPRTKRRRSSSGASNTVPYSCPAAAEAPLAAADAANADNSRLAAPNDTTESRDIQQDVTQQQVVEPMTLLHDPHSQEEAAAAAAAAVAVAQQAAGQAAAAIDVVVSESDRYYDNLPAIKRRRSSRLMSMTTSRQRDETAAAAAGAPAAAGGSAAAVNAQLAVVGSDDARQECVSQDQMVEAVALLHDLYRQDEAAAAAAELHSNGAFPSGNELVTAAAGSIRQQHRQQHSTDISLRQMLACKNTIKRAEVLKLLQAQQYCLEAMVILLQEPDQLQRLITHSSFWCDSDYSVFREVYGLYHYYEQQQQQQQLSGKQQQQVALEKLQQHIGASSAAAAFIQQHQQHSFSKKDLKCCLPSSSRRESKTVVKSKNSPSAVQPSSQIDQPELEHGATRPGPAAVVKAEPNQQLQRSIPQPALRPGRLRRKSSSGSSNAGRFQSCARCFSYQFWRSGVPHGVVSAAAAAAAPEVPCSCLTSSFDQTCDTDSTRKVSVDGDSNVQQTNLKPVSGGLNGVALFVSSSSSNSSSSMGGSKQCCADGQQVIHAVAPVVGSRKRRNPVQRAFRRFNQRPITATDNSWVTAAAAAAAAAQPMLPNDAAASQAVQATTVKSRLEAPRTGTRRQRPRLIVRPSAIAQCGVYTLDFIRAGTRVVEYQGEIVRQAVADRRDLEYQARGMGTYLFTLDRSKGLVVDATHRGNIARFINHSCEPNCQSIEQVGRGGRKRSLWLSALRDIQPGEELTYNYNLSPPDAQKPVDTPAANTALTAQSTAVTAIAAANDNKEDSTMVTVVEEKPCGEPVCGSKDAGPAASQDCCAAAASSKSEQQNKQAATAAAVPDDYSKSAAAGDKNVMCTTDFCAKSATAPATSPQVPLSTLTPDAATGDACPAPPATTTAAASPEQCSSAVVLAPGNSGLVASECQPATGGEPKVAKAAVSTVVAAPCGDSRTTAVTITDQIARGLIQCRCGTKRCRKWL